MDDNKHEVDFQGAFTPFHLNHFVMLVSVGFLSQYIFLSYNIFGISSFTFAPWEFTYKPCHSGNGILVFVPRVFYTPINTHPFITPLLIPRSKTSP